MPISAMCVLGKAHVKRAFPSFSVMEIIPVSAMAKFAPLMPTSAVRYLPRSTRRAMIMSSSGLSVGFEQIADFPAEEMHCGENEMVGRLVPELHDVLAEIAFNHRQPRLFQGLVEMNFLSGDHL